jgi:RHS repeat-associated protein
MLIYLMPRMAAYGSGVYVIVGSSGKILTSEDLVTWESRSSGVRGSLLGVVFGNSRFVAVGVSDIIYSLCEQSAAVSIVLNSVSTVINNEKLLRGGPDASRGGFLEKSPPGRRRQSNNDMTDRKVSLQLLSPNGNDILQAGEKFLIITWESEPNVEKVKLEYSPDNGTSYLPIAVDVVNTGHYEWLVPHHISSHCLVRVSEKKERKMPAHGLVYEMDFRVNGVDFSRSGDSLTIYLGDAANETIKNNLPRVSFGYEANGRVYMHLYGTSKEIGHFTVFNDKWHHIKIFMDNVYDRISVILDGKLVFESIPRSPMAYFSPAISFSVGAGQLTKVEIDDVVVRAWYSQDNGIQWFPLFREDFGQLKEKNDLGNCGWRTQSERIVESNQVASVLKALSIKAGENEQVTVVKTFNIPVDFPFDISDNTFEIRYNDDMYSKSAAYDDALPRHGGPSAFSGDFYLSSSSTLRNSTPGISRTSELFNTYYIYTFDGKLLAEYDHNGNCTRDYIYAGNRLIAEYKPQTSEYFYYMTDQINSTRIIINDSGNVVFSEAYGPYGDIQKTWTNTYDPKLKFSGKEREGYSDLDYFGARYYDHKSYRFNSVDPIINREEALYNPQLWNLYSYCRNNPITFMDTDGRRESIGDEYFKARERILRQYGPEAAAEFEEGYKTGMIISVAVAAAVAIPFIENEHCHSKPKKTNTVDDLIDSRDPHTTKGRSKMYDMEGGFEQANKDFDSLNPNNVRSYGDGKRVGVLKDGRKVIVRKDSEDGRPTLEIQKGKNKTKFRYDDK